MARILLADDDAATRDVVKRALEADGHEVIAHGDGADAWEAYSAAPSSFQLIVSDVDMPLMDGISLARHVADHAAPVGMVLMSAHDVELERAKGLSGVRVTAISKPFSIEAMRVVVSDLLS